MVPGSSSQARSAMPPASETVPSGDAGGDNVISDEVATMPASPGGIKGSQEDHAVMEYDGAELEHKTQKISSICFGIGSVDNAGEINALDYDEGLKEMASEYKAAVEDGRCFVHIRATRSNNKDMKMMSQLTQYRQFKKANLQGAGMDSINTSSKYIASAL